MTITFDAIEIQDTIQHLADVAAGVSRKSNPLRFKAAQAITDYMDSMLELAKYSRQFNEVESAVFCGAATLVTRSEVPYWGHVWGWIIDKMIDANEDRQAALYTSILECTYDSLEALQGNEIAGRDRLANAFRLTSALADPRLEWALKECCELSKSTVLKVIELQASRLRSLVENKPEIAE